MPRADVIAATSVASGTAAGGGTNYLVQTPAGVMYLVYIDAANDVMFRKSTDGGFTWSNPTAVLTGTAIAVSIWYDRWSGIAAGLIHIAYIETVGHDVLYRTIDTEGADALGTQTTIFNGASAVSAQTALSICRARGGNLGCVFNIDNGVEDGFAKSTDAGANWSAAADPTEGAAGDEFLLMPGWAVDSQDFMLFFWDASADEISRKLYDDSGDTWAETSISTGMVDRSPANEFPHFAAVVDTANSRNVLIAWSAIDTLNADLMAWAITESAITALTDVVTNSTDDQGFAAFGIATDTSTWYAFYGGKTDGSETFKSVLGVYYKSSIDGGVTWSAETRLSTTTYLVQNLLTVPRFVGSFVALWLDNSALTPLKLSVLIPGARARYILGGF